VAGGARKSRTAWRSSARSRADLGPTLARLGNRVRDLRTTKGYTQEQLAVRAQLDPKHVQAIEAGGSNVTVSTLLGLADGLGCEISELFRPRTAGR
jgi:transcriptional regulator with XRE-family HTH domain